MRSVIKTAMGVALAVVFAGTFGYAKFWSHHESATRSTNFDIASAAKVGSSAVLKAGAYKMEVPDNSKSPEVAFYQNGDLVARAQAQVVSESRKNSETSVEMVKQGNTERITQIRPSGWMEELDFSASAKSTQSGK
jgi:hypothetical protein